MKSSRCQLVELAAVAASKLAGDEPQVRGVDRPGELD
jgi:hypothetical protein